MKPGLGDSLGNPANETQLVLGPCIQLCQECTIARTLERLYQALGHVIAGQTGRERTSRVLPRPCPLQKAGSVFWCLERQHLAGGPWELKMGSYHLHHICPCCRVPTCLSVQLQSR